MTHPAGPAYGAGYNAGYEDGAREAMALLREWERWMRCEIKNAPRERTQALLARLEGNDGRP